MRLHDVQVAISASNVADRIQNNMQNQPQQAQAQAALVLNEQAKTQLTQAQHLGEKSASKALTPDDLRKKEWKKEKLSAGKYEKTEKTDEDNISQAGSSGTGHIIDIKV